jgi:4-azaleucine resistance transporter AzlC
LSTPAPAPSPALTPASARQEFTAGLAAVSPLLLGAVPFGLIYGALAVQAGIPPPLAIAISSIVFAGSAQFMITKLVAAATPGLLIVLSVAIINLRHALYSAALADKLAHLPLRWKLLLAYLLTDEAYAAALRRLQRSGDASLIHWHLMGTGLGLWIVWQLSCIAGVVLGGRIPQAWSLDFAGTLTFIAIVVPLLKDKPALAAMAAAGVVAVLVFALPYKLFIIAAALSGMAMGVLVERLVARQGAQA